MIAALVLAVSLAAPATASPAGDATFSDSAAVTRVRSLMGTLCSVQIATAPAARPRAAALAAGALDEIARLEPLFTSWDPESELQRLNARAAAGPVPCSPELFAVTSRALELARDTGGAFDPTVEPLMLAWDVRGAGRVPHPIERDSALARVGWRGVTCDAATRTVSFARGGMGLDLGGIGKGWALDRAASLLDSAEGGARTRVLFNFGGEVLARGPGRWTIELADPADRLRPVASIDVASRAVSTSGQREHSLRAGSRTIGHIVDPRTGEPVATSASVTVIAADATSADALSTALLVLGLEGASRYARAHPEVGVVWLEPTGRDIRGWRWNQEVRAAADGRVKWMN